MAKVVICEVILCIAYYTSKDVFGEPSRRLCNLPFVLYHVALINSFTCYLLIIDRALVTRHTNMVDNAVNYGQLQYFVWKNLLIGLGSLIFWTYYSSYWFSVAYMIVYFFISVWITNNCKVCHCCKKVF